MFISNKAKIKSFIEGDVIIFGPSIIEEKTIIGDRVTIGYPTRGKILSLEKISFEDYDKVSDGCKIGKNCIIRSNSIIYERVELGDYIETGHGVLIRENTIIGSKTKIGTYSVIDGNTKIGCNSNIQTGVYIPPGTQIGSNVFIGPYVTITNDKYPPSPKISSVIIEDEVIIGARAVIIAGVKIGRKAVIGAGAIVTKDVPPETVVIGIPARKLMSRSDYDKKQHNYLLH